MTNPESKPLREPEEEPKRQLFNPLDKVFVERSSGTIESDWTVLGYGEQGVIVVKADYDKRIGRDKVKRKEIPEDKLAALQEQMREKEKGPEK